MRMRRIGLPAGMQARGGGDGMPETARRGAGQVLAFRNRGCDRDAAGCGA